MVFEEVDDAALFIEWRYRHRDTPKLLLGQVGDGRSGGEPGKRAIEGMVFQQVTQKPDVKRLTGSDSVQRLLVCNVIGSTMPDGTATDLSPLTDK